VNKGFWGDLMFPIIGLSPMDGVTDAPWRFIAKKYGQPDVVYTEFVSVEGLWRIKKRGEMDHKIWRELAYDQTERPVVAQLFGSDPDSFYEATKIVCEFGFDGIDINMGCPSPGLERAGGGAGLIRDQGRAAAVIEATRRGVKDYLGINTSGLLQLEGDSSASLRSGRNDDRIPVTLKTRIGSAKPDESWWKFLASQEMPVVAMHGRTFKQLYTGEADWDLLFKAGEIIRESGSIYLANGDVKRIKVGESGVIDIDSRSRPGMTEREIATVRILPPEADKRNDELVVVLTSGKEIDVTNKVDGVLIGRSAMGNPWIFRKDGYEPSLEEKLKVAIEHSRKFEELMVSDYTVLNRSPIESGMTGVRLPRPADGESRNDNGNNFFPMRKHLAWYAHGFSSASELRRKLVMTNSSAEVRNVVEEFLGGG